LCYLGLWLYGVPEALPLAPLQCLAALAAITSLGIAVGLINAVISAYFFAWLYIYAVLIRGWLVFSGVLFVVDRMPPQLRDIAVWNPLSHAITWYRVGHYAGYPANSLDRQYLLVSAFVMLAVAWLVLTSTRRSRPVR
jgi:ABC-type polysaccharide/polyol phosphate export permease